ncbi:threonine synthase [Dichomitus squalens]|uniref:threonine synthase n=1 Tax=Dichomitus squalens TaxID=114155 RepID=A0A4Q9Q7Q9_9APHY|nr:threonine synthase [Dichomitus squalens]
MFQTSATTADMMATPRQHTGGRQRVASRLGAHTVLAGLAPDGGLYIPEHIPSLPGNWQTAWRNHSFVDLSIEVLSLYVTSDEISRDELRQLVEKSYSTFRHPDITPLKKLTDSAYILELFHGPTFAFKDVALQLLGNLFEFFLKRRNQHKAPNEKPEKLTVVGATSGDTGSAAIYGLRNKANVSIFILHPKGRVSPIQEAQMTTVTDPNVHNLAVKGTFDDCQDIVKSLFADREFNAKHRLGAVNSINWARILAQTVYYFLSYFHLKRQVPNDADLEIQYVVPTGNFGDILAGYYAKRMGLPIGRLGIATNANDILARFWKSGAYEKVDSSRATTPAGETAPAAGASDGKQAEDTSGVRETLSPAMDILVSSNFERLLWYLAYDSAKGSDDAEKRRSAGATIAEWMGKVKSDGRVQVPTEVLDRARRDFFAERVSDEQTLETIRYYFESARYIADPHTAVGLYVARVVAPSNPPNVRQIVLSTAHPAKFSEAVTRALEGSPSFNFERDVLPPEFKGLLERERRVIDVEGADVELVKEVIEKYVVQDVGQVGADV